MFLNAAQCFHDQVWSFLTPARADLMLSYTSRATNFPILLFIAWYERQSKSSGSSSFYETMTSVAEKIFDTLPRQVKRLSEYFRLHRSYCDHEPILAAFFESWSGHGTDIDAVIIFTRSQACCFNYHPDLRARRRVRRKRA